jgi:hypothetical protein
MMKEKEGGRGKKKHTKDTLLLLSLAVWCVDQQSNNLYCRSALSLCAAALAPLYMRY